MNPSRANDRVLDDTWKRMLRFTQQLGCGELAVVNLVPYRSSWPCDAVSALRKVRSGEQDGQDLAVNLEKVRAVAAGVNDWVAIWGDGGAQMDRTLACKGDLLRTIESNVGLGVARFLSFGLTKRGRNPKHILARDITYGSSLFEYDPWQNELGPAYAHMGAPCPDQ